MGCNCWPTVSFVVASAVYTCTECIHLLIFYIRVEMEEPPLVKTAANLFRRFCYQYRDQTVAGILCAGWDEREGGQVGDWVWSSKAF